MKIMMAMPTRKQNKQKGGHQDIKVANLLVLRDRELVEQQKRRFHMSVINYKMQSTIMDMIPQS